jgi:hypothetical protein
MKYRKLQITWSVAWGIACLLSIALWVRSCWWVEIVYVPLSGNRVVGVGILPGSVGVGISDPNIGMPSPDRYLVEPVEYWLPQDRQHSRFWGFFEIRAGSVFVPIWLVLVTIASIGTIPWLRQLPYQFSLRSLLIAMTLVAVGLGWAIYVLRN